MFLKNFLLAGTKKIIRMLLFFVIGGVLTLLAVFVLYLENRPDLNIWHEAELDEEFTAESSISDFTEYLKLEKRLFQQLEKKIYAKIGPEARQHLNRFNSGSMADPNRWSTNWNRTFEFSPENSKAGVLLLHGMSDSPYSLNNLGTRLHEKGVHVIGLRVPGHGTTPSGLVEVHWHDMAAAVRLAMSHLQKNNSSKPLFIVGYSNGSALAVHYALSTMADPQLPQPKGLVLISPAIGVSPLAAFAVWQARLGHFLGLEKLAWNSIELEYDPFKYNSFAINAGDQVHRLTREIQKLLNNNNGTGDLARFPPILAFQSAVDTTVSTEALINGLFEKLPAAGHELVIFDINRRGGAENYFKNDPGSFLESLLQREKLHYALTLITNENDSSTKVHGRHKKAGNGAVTSDPLNASWPSGIHSLSHISLPFPKTDPLYGENSSGENPGVRLGNTAVKGERGALQIPASAMLRLRWNPFYSYLEHRTLAFMNLQQ